MFSEFLITDGTTQIDFLGLNKRGFGVGIVRYTPGRPNLKSGGIWQDSPLGAGRRLVHGSKGNVNDAIEFRIGYANHVEIISAQQELDLLLEKAIAYWTSDWQDEPVYIKARVAGESNPRYAVIHSAEFPTYPDPYDQPYAGGGHRFVLEGMILGIERGDWLGNAPGTGASVTLSHTAYTGTSIYIGNGYSPSGITEIRRYSDTVGSYSSNLLDASLPYNLLDPTGVAAEDTTTAIYFGSPYPFTSVVFNIGTAATNLNIVWEIATGASSWTEVSAISGGQPLRDETENFSLSGVHIVQWYNNNEWIRRDHNSYGVLWWIRARLESVDVGALTAPTQTGNDPYTTKMAYVEMAADQITGDLDALAAIQVSVKERRTEESLLGRQLMIGLRSLDRGEDFNAYINPRTADNPTGVSVDYTQPTSHGNATTIGEPYYQSPTRFALRYTSTDGDVLDEMFRINFDSSVVRQYYGIYRLFVKCHVFDRRTTSQLRARVKFVNAWHEWTGETITLTAAMFNGEETSTTDIALVELGRIQIPPTITGNPTDEIGTVSLVIDALCALQQSPGGEIPGGVQTISIYEIVLLPVDEWAATATGQTTDDQGDIKLNMDSVGYPKQAIRSLVLDPDNNQIIDNFALVSPGRVTLPANNEQRLWFLQKNVDPHFGTASEVTVQVNPRYHFLRGS